MRIAIYARVSTRDKEQNPETQLQQLRDFCAANGWLEVKEYVDTASAKDMKNRKGWRRLLDDASKRKIDLVLVWKLDRAFRSVLDSATTFENFKSWGVAFRSYQEPWLDTSSAFGEVLFYITSAYAQLERAMIQERVRAGMERAKREGKKIGNPGLTDKKKRAVDKVSRKVIDGTLSYRAAAKEAKVGLGTIQRAVKEMKTG